MGSRIRVELAGLFAEQSLPQLFPLRKLIFLCAAGIEVLKICDVDRK